MSIWGAFDVPEFRVIAVPPSSLEEARPNGLALHWDTVEGQFLRQTLDPDPEVGLLWIIEELREYLVWRRRLGGRWGSWWAIAFRWSWWLREERLWYS